MLKLSMRGELEITDLHQSYLDEGKLDTVPVKGVWIGTGTFESMFEATGLVRSKNRKVKPA